MLMLVVSGSYQNCENGVVSQLMVVGKVGTVEGALVNLLISCDRGSASYIVYSGHATV